jgi:hypothetical protein
LCESSNSNANRYERRRSHWLLSERTQAMVLLATLMLPILIGFVVGLLQ